MCSYVTLVVCVSEWHSIVCVFVYAFVFVPPRAGLMLACLCVVFRACATACMYVLCVVCVFVCHACMRVESGPPYFGWQGGPFVCVCACVRERVCVSGWWRWNELERKETRDGGGEGGRAMTLQQGRPARSSASYLFPLRGINSPPLQS